MYKKYYKLLFIIYSIIYFISLLNDLNGRYVIDSISSIQQILGQTPISNWHPVAYTFFYIYPLYKVFNSDFTNVTLFQGTLFYILNLCILLCIFKIIKREFHPQAQLLQLILYGIYLLHPLQFNFPFILWKDTAYTLIYTLCLTLFFFTKTNPFLLLFAFCYTQMLRHFGNFMLLITSLIFFCKIQIQRTVFSKKLFYILPFCFLCFSLFINYKLDRIDGTKNFIVESLGIAQCPNTKLPLFCSKQGIVAKKCFSGSNVDTCIADNKQFSDFFNNICNPNIQNCKNEAYIIRLSNFSQYIRLRVFYIYRIIYRPLGDFSGEDGKLFLPCFGLKTSKQFFDYFDGFSRNYSRFIYIFSVRMVWSQLLGLFSLLAVSGLYFKYKNLLSHELVTKLQLAIIFTAIGFTSVLFGPFVANCFRYLWPYSQGAVLILIFTIPLFSRVFEYKKNENTLY